MTAGLRLASWNVHGSARPATSLLAGVIADLGVDAAALQEVRRHQAVAIARHLGWPDPFWTFKHNGWHGLPRRAEGLALLSSEPLDDRRTTVLSSASPRWHFGRRVAQRASTHGLTIVNVHLASGDARTERAAQVARAVVFSAGAHVIAGDLNDDACGPSLATLREAGDHDVYERAAERHGGPFTSPTQDPARRIDHVLVVEAIEVCRVRVPPATAKLAMLSDHLPIVAELAPR